MKNKQHAAELRNALREMLGLVDHLREYPDCNARRFFFLRDGSEHGSIKKARAALETEIKPFNAAPAPTQRLKKGEFFAWWTSLPEEMKDTLLRTPAVNVAAVAFHAAREKYYLNP